MATLSRDELLARKIHDDVETYELDDGSGEVIIRGLTRRESKIVREVSDDPDVRDVLMISFALVEPKMTKDDVETWFENGSAGVLIKLSNRISEISGMVEGAGKSGVSRARQRRRS